jgi:adenosylmethionine-8-amino-7-oxononanoate aminotransferase
VRDKKTKELFDASAGAARNVWIAALGEGVIVRPLTGDVLAISPPFVITEPQIDRIVDSLHTAIDAVSKTLLQSS